MATDRMDLVGAWRAWKGKGPPFVLDADRPFTERLGLDRAVAHGWKDEIEQTDFLRPGDRRFHLGLLPIPFVGDLARASIYILLLNPGYGPHDYFGDYAVPELKAALLANLKQRRNGSFVFLDPKFSWHGGFGWWHGKFAALIAELSARDGTSFADARHRLARELACIELIPYHSPSFRDPGRWVQRLPSAQMARTLVQESVLQRVEAGKAIVVVGRKAAVWALPKHKRIIAYEGSEARAAHLTPNSRGGRAILEHMGRL